ncbi:hypothetical protein Salat_1150200 [Sesamum alatum]|uniref:Uncharacterized protein n=1 Tax=Sesamum alatum TaxID=300844 RepID=A0AAE1YEQ4_9LAMI|nr:hypothetical protein Salat_1150200 [Sesamum alatum]
MGCTSSRGVIIYGDGRDVGRTMFVHRKNRCKVDVHAWHGSMKVGGGHGIGAWGFFYVDFMHVWGVGSRRHTCIRDPPTIPSTTRRHPPTSNQSPSFPERLYASSSALRSVAAFLPVNVGSPLLSTTESLPPLSTTASLPPLSATTA